MSIRRRAIVAVPALALVVAAIGIAAPSASGARSSAGAPATTAPTTVPRGIIPILWRNATASGATVNQPVLWQNRVIVTADNTTRALRLALGSTIWSVTHPDEFGNHLTLGAPTLVQGSIDASLYAQGGAGSVIYNPLNGQFTENSPAFHTLRGQLVVDGQLSALVGGAYGSGVGPLYSLAFGRTWWITFGSAAIGTPLISGGRAWVPVDAAIYMFDSAGPCIPVPIPGAPPWCLPTATIPVNPSPQRPSYAGPGRVAIASNGTTGIVNVYSNAPQLVWTFTSSTALGPTAWSNNKIYVGGADGIVRVLDAATGTQLWTGDAGAPITVAPTITNGKVYVATNGARLVTFPAGGCGAATCAPIATGDAHKSGTVAAGPPLVRNGVVVTAFGNEVVAFSAG